MMSIQSRWDTLPLTNESRAWFVTDMNLRPPSASHGKLSMIVEMPKMRCHWIKFLSDRRAKWLQGAVRQTAILHMTPDVFVTDARALYPELVAVAASINPPATAIIDIPITAVLELGALMKSLETPLGASRFNAAKDQDEINVVLQGWLEEHALQSVKNRLR
jgi:hypothetical protein